MAVVIRMKRTGRKNRPCYRISVPDSRAPRDGRTLETLGLYDPIAPRGRGARLTLDVERASHWLATAPSRARRWPRSSSARASTPGARPSAKRDRTGRKTKTKTGERRTAAKKARAERKAARAKA